MNVQAHYNKPRDTELDFNSSIEGSNETRFIIGLNERIRNSRTPRLNMFILVYLSGFNLGVERRLEEIDLVSRPI